jgi:hypothetical protein
MFMLETKRSSNFEAYLKFLIMRGYLEVQNWTIYECSCSFGISRRKREIVNCDYSAPSSSVYLWPVRDGECAKLHTWVKAFR